MTAEARMPMVVIESPFKGNIERNCRYADALLFDALMRGEAPFLGHLLYTRVLNDLVLEHRRRGIEAHIALIERADYIVLGVDYGISEGMQEAWDFASQKCIPVKQRKLGESWQTDILPMRTPGLF